jgi:hypothetical protein
MISTVIELLEQDELDFGKLEQLAWRVLREEFQQLLVKLLEELDKYLLAARDEDRYQLKDRKQRTLQTLVGELTFSRRYYWDSEAGEWCFLLDEQLGLEPHDRAGPGLLELAVTWACRGPSYRDARDRLTELYGAQVLSHESIRQALLQAAATAERQASNEALSCEGQREVEALFVEADGFHVALQDSTSQGRSWQEAQLVVVHEGWARRQGQGRRADYRLVNPQYFVLLEPTDDLWEWVRGQLASRYANLEAIPVIINGDGAAWIRRGTASFTHGFYQYDRYHLSRSLRAALGHQPQQLRAAQQALREEDLGSVAIIVTEVEQRTAEGDQQERLTRLRQLLAEQYPVLRDYRVQLREAGFDVAPDWRSMGAAESNVDRFKNRMAKRGRAWSVAGGQGMLMALGKFFEGHLAEFVTQKLAALEDWVLDNVTQGAGRIADAVARPSIGARTGHFPALDHGTQGYAPLFRRLIRLETP